MYLRLSYVSVLAIVILSDVSFGRRIRRQDDGEGEETTPAEGGGGGEAGPAKKCLKCISYDDCGGMRETIMDCSTEKMSSAGLAGDEKELWDIIVADAPDLDEPMKYDQCVTVQWEDKAEFRGCAPSKIGDKDVCDYIKDKGGDKKVECTACIPTEEMCNNNTALKETSGSRRVSVDVTTLCLIISAFLFKLML